MSEVLEKRGRIAQLVRAPSLYLGGRRFESYCAHVFPETERERKSYACIHDWSQVRVLLHCDLSEVRIATQSTRPASCASGQESRSDVLRVSGEQNREAGLTGFERKRGEPVAESCCPHIFLKFIYLRGPWFESRRTHVCF